MDITSVLKSFNKSKTVLINPRDIIPNPLQPRRFFDRADLQSLASSIKSCGPNRLGIDGARRKSPKKRPFLFRGGVGDANAFEGNRDAAKRACTFAFYLAMHAFQQIAFVAAFRKRTSYRGRKQIFRAALPRFGADRFRARPCRHSSSGYCKKADRPRNRKAC